jgi:ribonucleotide monophosphatase NagD (HAD superfamily)
MDGLVTEALNGGFDVISSKIHNSKILNNDDEFLNINVDGIDAILVGFDVQFNYYKLAFGSLVIQRGGYFFATDLDAFDMIGTRKGPGTGCMVSAIQNCTETKPVVFGKPSEKGIESLIEEH